MRLLTRSRPLLLALACCLGALVLASPDSALAHPPNETDHGVDESTFQVLWSGDVDLGENGTLPNESAWGDLAAATDVPLSEPPAAVEQWNRGDHREFPESGHETAYAPSGATLTDGRFVRDAHATVFEIEPSTRVLRSPDEETLLVAPNGSVLAVVDYRVAVPQNVSGANRSVSWTLLGHEITDVRLRLDDTVVASTRAPDTHTPVLDFENLTVGTEPRALTLEANVSVALLRTTSRNGTCDANDSCNATTTVTPVNETVTVAQTRSVVVYDVDPTVLVTDHPDGGFEMAVTGERPWLGVRSSNGTAYGTWDIYTARDRAWDTLVVSTASGTDRVHSPAHPFRVIAYPSAIGPTTSDNATVDIVAFDGPERESPPLPENVSLDVAASPYTESQSLVVSVPVAEERSLTDTVAVGGLVRGVDTPVRSYREIQLRRSTLTLTVQDRTKSTLVVAVSLTDERGWPISTGPFVGHVVVEGERVETNRYGVGVVTILRTDGVLTARFVPRDWWDAGPRETMYLESTDVLYVRGTTLDLWGTLWGIAVPLGLLLGGAFVVDRFTGWRLWPPWRDV